MLPISGNPLGPGIIGLLARVIELEEEEEEEEEDDDDDDFLFLI